MVGFATKRNRLIAIFAAAYARSASFRKAVADLGSMLASTFKPVVDTVIAAFKQLVKDIIKTVTVVANQLAPVMKALMPVFKLVATFLAGRLKNSFNLIIGVIRVMLAVVRTVATVFSSVFTKVVSIANGAVNKIKSAFSKVKNALTHPFETAKDIISGIVNKIKGFFPIKIGNIFSGLKTPHFTLDWDSKDFGPLGKIRYPKGFGVDWYARGGIFNRPTLAGIGEAGPEAVVPLDKLWEKLDQLQGGNTINIYPPVGANSEEIAEYVMQKIIQLQNRRRLAWR